ncbi:MAG: hypothetical protein R3E64_04175 [Halioglobus sp.]
MHAAQIHKSERLQRVDALLADGNPHSTMEIIEAANVCAVNSIVAELRANGRTISCQRVDDVWFYQMETKQ